MPIKIKNETKNKFYFFFRNKGKKYEFFVYFVQNLVLKVLNFIPFNLFLTKFNTLVLLLFSVYVFFKF
jgi:hypothetical protein